MSYYFVIVGTKDNPLFEYEFGTSKAGGDGVSHFRDDARRLNQFILHSSLDLAEDAQWTSGAMYLRTVDRFYNSHISLFQTGARAKFLLLHNPDPLSLTTSHLFPFSQHLNPFPSDKPIPTSNILGAPSTAASSVSATSNVSRPTSSSTNKSSMSSLMSSSTILPSSASSTTSKRNSNNSVAHNPSSPQAEEAVRQFFADVYENWLKAVMSPFYVLDDPVRSPVFRGRVAAAARKYL